ncbi:uncharacterized protein CIMG_00708 [Coccidioides immitis RS]|uniref:Uncharacterized protein n=1 Tax=Coccidioides immitis (strain RS) TaxID=246410 RepID=J3KHK1_COCIM|nr:uncharacterized protein CIMG_00708 [Coccidioides immitis RS]EAS35354.3 hypothetical protein CIMG_00708 [Coccidioides immitis RS]
MIAVPREGRGFRLGDGALREYFAAKRRRRRANGRRTRHGRRRSARCHDSGDGAATPRRVVRSPITRFMPIYQNTNSKIIKLNYKKKKAPEN